MQRRHFDLKIFILEMLNFEQLILKMLGFIFCSVVTMDFDAKEEGTFRLCLSAPSCDEVSSKMPLEFYLR